MSSRKSVSSLKNLADHSNSDRVKLLQHSYASYVSHLTKSFNKLEVILNFEDPSETEIANILTLKDSIKRDLEKLRQKISDYKTLITDNDLIAKVNSLYKTQIDKYANIQKELKQFFIKNKFENENQSINSSAVMSISQQTVNSSKKSLFKFQI